MSKHIVFDVEAHRKAADGIEKLAKAVGGTLGPSGQYVMIENPHGSPIITNDGVTVAKQVELEDPFENMGAKMAIEVASKTNDEAGDGTTTATVIADAIIKQGLKRMAVGHKTQGVRRGIDKAVTIALDELKEISREVNTKKELEAVATISASQDSTIGKLMAEALEKVGPRGVISIREGHSMQIELKYVEGLAIDSGYLSPHFTNSEDHQSCNYEDALVLVVNGQIGSVQDVVPVLEACATASKPLLIIADQISNDVLTLLVINRLRGSIQPIAIQTPAAGAARRGVLEDIALSVGATIIDSSSEITLQTVKLEHLGKAARVECLRHRTTIFGDNVDKKVMKAHIKKIKLQEESTLDEREADLLRRRIAVLTSSIAQLDVGGTTKSEISEKMFRVEDALHATRAAKQEGIVPGGGVVYIRASQAIRNHKGFTTDEQVGAMILAAALEEPAKLIAANAGYEGAEVVSKIKSAKTNEGFDAATGKYGDMMKLGIIDPTKVVRCAIQNAASIASLILCTNTLVTEKFDDESRVVR